MYHLLMAAATLRLGMLYVILKIGNLEKQSEILLLYVSSGGRIRGRRNQAFPLL